MENKKNTDKLDGYYDVRVRVPKNLGKLFVEESKKERRKHGEQLAKILEERYIGIDF